ncbi:MAG: aryl-sulfate sulfotransferase [Candidatus Thorarchaeota archaeon]
MKKRIKIILIAIGSLLLIIIASAVGLFFYIKIKFRPVPFNLEDAPQHILDIRDDLREKLKEDTFTWSDMADFVIFGQYVGDNSPVILDLVKDWEEVVFFNITDEEYMWFFIGNDSIIYEVGPNPPTNYGILIELDFSVTKDILRQDTTPQKAVMKGTLHFEGEFKKVLKVNQIVETVAATLMGTYAPPVDVSSDIAVRIDKRNLYDNNGLALLPIIQINLRPDQIGVPHVSTPVPGTLKIINNLGETIAELDDVAHTVCKFINSTSVLMGGQEGFMEIWNYKTGVVESLNVPGGHHDFDYNPETDTFMVLEYVYSNTSETWDGYTILYDKLGEYNRNGDLIWEWDGRVGFPFNSTRHTRLGMNLTFLGGADWMHSNSFAWDKQNEAIYLNIRNVNVIAKIDYNTKDIVWEAGEETNFTIYNKEGEIVPTIFYSPHGFEKIDDDRFLAFDNDLYNVTNPQTMTLEGSLGYSRLLEFEIDEVNKTMKELWSWVPSNQSYYSPESAGDVNRLPDGNTIGVFANKAMVLNMRDPIFITEVTPGGEIAWELVIDGENNTYFWVQNFLKFYEKPVIKIQDNFLDVSNGILNLNFSVWDCYRRDYATPGTVSVIVDDEEIYSDTFEFPAYWKAHNLSISLDNIPKNAKSIELIIENQDDIQGISILYFGGLSTANKIIISCASIAFVGGLVATYFILRKRNLLPKILTRE